MEVQQTEVKNEYVVEIEWKWFVADRQIVCCER